MRLYLGNMDYLGYLCEILRRLRALYTHVKKITTETDMKNRILALTAVLTMCIAGYAQSSMTDDQVMQYIIKEAEKGTSQQKIVTSLIKNGVTTTQLQRVRRKAEQQKRKIEKEKKEKEKKDNEIEDGMYVNPTARRNEEVRGTTRNENLASYANDHDIGDYVEPDDSDALYHDRRVVFGRNIFSTKDLTFQPSANIATPASYTMGPGDQVSINIWGASQATIEGTVNSDGYLVIEGIGPVKLAGLSVNQAKAALRKRLGARYTDSHIDMSLTDSRSIQVQVMGEVRHPGSYTLSGLSSAFNALYMAGGISDIGTLRDIHVYRNGHRIATIDVYDYILNGNVRGNVHLQDNDVIVVGAYDCLVQVKGNVKRPMWYEMKKTETVRDVLDYSGGFAGNAYTKSVRLLRKAGSENSIHTIDEFQMRAFTLADEDVVEVDSTRTRYSNIVEVRGAVKHAGRFELGNNIQTVRELMLAAEGLREDAYQERAIMHREKEDLTLEMVSVDIPGIMAGTTSDIPLRNNDVLFIPSRTEMLGDRTIEVSGEVTYPGVYPFAENMTIQDILLEAGGLTEAASLARVDVFRRVRDAKAVETKGQSAEHFAFSLNEKYDINGDTTFYLRPYDVVVIRKSPAYEEQQTVQVRGEVAFQGDYSMTSKNYRLSDLIKASGGLTSMAYSNGAHLTRVMTKEEIEQRDEANRKALIQLYEDGLKEGKDMNMQIADSLFNLKKNTKYTFPVAIDLTQAMAKPGSDFDIELRKGDILEIPVRSNIVKVSGEVMYPVSMSYEKDKNLNYYLSRAGGLSGNASRSRIYGIHQNGSVVKLSSNSVRDIQPGTEIVVPQKKTRKRMTTGEIVGIASGVASLGAIIVSLLNVIKK